VQQRMVLVFGCAHHTYCWGEQRSSREAPLVQKCNPPLTSLHSAPMYLLNTSNKRVECDVACRIHHTAFPLRFFSCCGVQVILPLALTVAKQQQELAAAAAAKPTMKPGAAVSVAGRDTTPPECMDMIPKGTHTPAHTLCMVLGYLSRAAALCFIRGRVRGGGGEEGQDVWVAAAACVLLPQGGRCPSARGVMLRVAGMIRSVAIGQRL